MPASTFEQRNPFDARHPELEAAIEQTDETDEPDALDETDETDGPDALDAYSVLADWLISRGDPRGDLIMLQIAEELDPTPARAAAVTDLYERYKEYFLGPLGRNLTVQDNSGAPAFQWRRGYIHRATLSQLKYSRFTGTIGEALAALLDHPSARFLRALSLGFNTPERDHQLPIDVLASRAPRALRALYLGPGADPALEAHGIWRDLGALAPLWPALPHLETLVVAGQTYALGELALPALRHLELRQPAVTTAALAAIARAAWPSLRRLVIWHGLHTSARDALAALRAFVGADAADAANGAVGAIDAPQLEHFGLVHSHHADAVCGVLCTAPSLAGIRSLDLSRGTLTDDGAEALARGLARLPALRHLDVSRNHLTEQGTTLLASLVPSVVVHGQRERSADADADVFDY